MERYLVFEKPFCEMKWRLNLLVFILVLHSGFSSRNVTPRSLTERCRQEERAIYCDNVEITDITIPDNVTDVYLSNFNISSLSDGTFQQNFDWKRVLKLDISDSSNNESELNDFAFSGLENVQYLGIHHMQLFDVYPKAFYGLDNLLVLDFSGNNYVGAPLVFQSLYFANMPHLHSINFNMMQSYYVEPVNFMENFFIGITKNGSRRLRNLDVSNMNVGFVDYNLFFKYNVCNSLENFITRNSTFQNVRNYVQLRTCTALKRFDISGAIVPITRLKVDFQTTNFFCMALLFYFNIEELNLDNIFHTGLSQPFIVTNFTLDMSMCPMRLKKVTKSHNLFKVLNATVILHPTTTASFVWYDISHNIIEYISPKLLQPSTNLRHLDLSDNHLHVMQSYHSSDLEMLLAPHTKLEFLGLARNSFSSLPYNMFATNLRLVHLDLSDNSLTTINFKLDQLTELNTLWLKGNRIKTIAPLVQMVFERIAYNGQEDSNTTLRVDISQNPLDCSCNDDNGNDIKWVQHQMGSILFGNQSEYMCVLDNKKVYIQEDAVKQVKEYCEWQETKRNLLIVLPILAVFSCVAILTITIIVIKIRRKRQMKKYYSNVVALLKHGLFPKKNLVFLSYCSEDEDLVASTILPLLEQKLQQMTSTSKRLVCTGDTGFRPGYSISEELIRCIDESAVTILIMSNKYCRKDWCKTEIKETYDQNKPIIMLMLETLETNLMDPVLLKIFNSFSRSAWVSDDNGGYLKPDWPVFCEAVIGLAGQSVDGCIEMSKIEKLDCEAEV